MTRKKSFLKFVIFNSILAITIMFYGCGGNAETPEELGKIIYSAITEMDSTKILKYQLKAEDVALITKELSNESEYSEIVKKLNKVIKYESRFLNGFSRSINNLMLSKKKKLGGWKIEYNNFILGKYDKYSERIQRFTRSRLNYFQIHPTRGVHDDQIWIREIWMIDGKLKILDW